MAERENNVKAVKPNRKLMLVAAVLLGIMFCFCGCAQRANPLGDYKSSAKNELSAYLKSVCYDIQNDYIVYVARREFDNSIKKPTRSKKSTTP